MTPTEVQSIRKFKGIFDNAKAAGAVPDLRNYRDGAIAAASTTFRSASIPFNESSPGKVICVNGAGAAGAALITTIASFTAEDEVELTSPALTEVADADFVFGTDNAEALARFKAKCTSFGRIYLLPSGRYLTTSPLHLSGANIECVGHARDNVSSTVICYVGTDCAVKIEPTTPGTQCFAANFRDIAIATFGGAAAAISATNLSQAIFTNVGINQLYGASSAIGFDLVNSVILKFTFPIIQNCGSAVRISSTGFPDSVTNVVFDGGNYYENEIVFDIQANLVMCLIGGGIHFEHFNSLVKIDREVGAADLQINSLTIHDCEITASTGGWTSKIFDVRVPGITTLIGATLRFKDNWVFFGDPPVENPFYFDVAETATLDMDLHIDCNVFGNIDTSLCHIPSAAASVYYGPNRKRFGADFAVMSAGSAALLYAPVYGGELLTSNTSLLRSSNPGKVSPISGLDWFNDALHIQKDPDATTGQFEISDEAFGRVLRLSVPAATYTAILKFAGALGALAINGLLTVGSDEEPTVTLFVHKAGTGEHTQFAVKANAADGSGNAIVNILTSAAVAAFQIMGDGIVYLPLIPASKPMRVGPTGQVTSGPISLTSTNDADVSGLTDGALVKRSGSVLASVSAFATARVLISNGSGAIDVLSAMSADLPMMTAGDGLPITTSWANIYTNIKTAIDGDFVSNTDLATNVYTKSEIDAMLADYVLTMDLLTALGTKSDVGHTHGYSGTTGTTAGHDHSYSGTAS